MCIRDRGFVIIGDHDDALILRDMRCHQGRARIVERAFGIVDERHVPTEAREQRRDDQEQDRRRHPRRTELHDAVSYTHLDVYKRQLLSHSLMNLFGRRSLWIEFGLLLSV